MIHSQHTSGMTKHVGTYNDKKCVIVLRLPEATHEVHIIDTDSLPDLYHQNLMQILTSPEGQEATWLGDVLSRKMLFDGSNALRTFYERQNVLVVPATNVFLTPVPNMPIPFTQVYPVTTDPLAATQNPAGTLEEEHAALAAAEQAKLDANMAQVDTLPDPGHNQHAQNLAGDVTDERRQIAQNLIIEAQLLEADAEAFKADAAAKRAQAAAYSGVPVESTKSTESAEFVDHVTGRTYKSASALKGAITRRENAN